MPDEIPMPPGGAEAGESTWSAAEKLADAHEASLRAKGEPIPGEQAGSIVSSEPVAHTAEVVKPEPGKPAKPAAKPAAAVPAADKSAIIKEIEALAAKAGMKVDANRVEVAERVALREEKRRFRESAAREQSEIRARLAKEMQDSADARGKAEAFTKALDGGDFDGMARAAGFKDWREMLNEQTKRMASPEYRRVQELERREQERERAAKEADERRIAAEQQQQQARSIQEYKAAMADELKTHEGMLGRMAADPDIVDLLYQVRAEHYRATGDELELAELAEQPARVLGGKSALDLLRSKWEALNEIFGDHPADLDEADSSAARRGGQPSRSRERKPPKVVSQRNAAEASAQPTFDDTPEGQKAYKAYFTQLLNQSTHPS